MMLTNKERLEERIKSLKSKETEEYQLERDQNILQANYLSEIERLKKPLKLDWKDLAESIKVTPSFLSQIFRGKKPLNFKTIAKLQRIFNVRFEVKAVILNDVNNIEFHQIKSAKEIIRTVNKDVENSVLSIAFIENNPQHFEQKIMS